MKRYARNHGLLAASLSLLGSIATAPAWAQSPSSSPTQAKTATQPGAPRPNIILILCDDLGYGDLSCFGQKNFSTPNEGRLKNGGGETEDGEAERPNRKNKRKQGAKQPAQAQERETL